MLQLWVGCVECPYIYFTGGCAYTHTLSLCIYTQRHIHIYKTTKTTWLTDEKFIQHIIHSTVYPSSTIVGWRKINCVVKSMCHPISLLPYPLPCWPSQIMVINKKWRDMLYFSLPCFALDLFFLFSVCQIPF